MTFITTRKALQVQRILLVEDEPSHVTLIQRAFEGLETRYQLTHAGTLQEANERIKRDRPHLVLSDYKLPDGNGTQLIPSHTDDIPSPPVVIMTSQGSETLAVEALKRGAIDYVVKSSESLADIPNVVERVLREWGHIVQRDKAVQQLREQEKRLRLVTDAMPALIAYVDQKCQYQFVNAGFERWYQHPKDWFLGRTVRSVLSVNAYTRFEACFRKVFEGEGASFEDWGLGASKEPRYLRSECVPHVAEDGTVLGGYILMTDLTDLKRAQEEQSRLQEKLIEQERLATIGTTAAMFAHEIANPLNNMSLRMQLLERKLKKNNEKRLLSDVHALKGEISRLNNLLEEFSTLSRHQQLRMEPLDITKVLKDVLMVYLPPDQITVVRDFDEKLPTILGSADKLKQVFLNLIKNAVEAMPKGGKLTLKTYRTGKTGVVEVADTGVGILSDMDIFEAFQTTKPRGTGLGLAIVRQLIFMHKGNITYRSEAGVGTSFCVTLPLSTIEGFVTSAQKKGKLTKRDSYLAEAEQQGSYTQPRCVESHCMATTTQEDLEFHTQRI